MSLHFQRTRPTPLFATETVSLTSDIAPSSNSKNSDTSLLQQSIYTPPPSSSFASYSPPWISARDLLRLSSLYGVRIENFPLFSSWGLFCLTLLWCSVTLYYAYNATLSNPNQHFIPSDPQWTIGILNFMSAASAFLLAALMETVLDRVRWMLASQPNGIALKNFLGLSPATGFAGLFVLLISTVGKSHLGAPGTKRRWFVQRYILPDLNYINYKRIVGFLIIAASKLILICKC